ncbi:GNAT family N-acetyltransferase [Ferrimonas balearica]|uniref:GNAT family N-acetyltransferase n=1 Tax=Ferrimonas balearica TaxID=44012 RepID=UPI001C9971C2|nr:GNAT family N-acetyltransferase [Ferrimonas balearica]MBY5992057.1 GNAT family N-acetyltransferase [Ferrimonas balearica]
MFFTTARLTVRPRTLEDLDWIHQLESDPDVMRFTDTPVQTRDQVKSRLRQPLPADSFALVVLDELGEGIGTLSTWRNDKQQMELGFMLASRTWGQGYGSELVRAWGHRFQQVQPGQDLHAFVYRDNGASCKVVERAGFIMEREWLNVDSQLWDRHYRLPALG